jgi:hypothetical protein
MDNHEIESCKPIEFIHKTYGLNSQRIQIPNGKDRLTGDNYITFV